MPLVLRLVKGSPLTNAEVDGNFTYLETKPADNIAGGELGYIPYQSDTDQTTLLAPSTAGYVLTTNGAGQAPSWQTTLKPSDIGTIVQAYDSDLTNWAGKSTPIGEVVGTSDEQILTNKTISGIKETKINMPSNDIDLSLGNYFTKTISGATTLTVSNVPAAGTASSFIFDLTNGGSATITWWSGIKWAAGTAPTLTTSGRDVLGFFTHDGGTTWNGILIAKDVR